METIKHFSVHVETGDIYAIEQSLDAKLLGACGPLAENNLKNLNRYNYNDEQNNWIRRNWKRLILWFP